MNTSLIIGIVVLIVIVIIIAVVLYFYMRGGSTDTSADTAIEPPVSGGTKWSFYQGMDSSGGDDRALSLSQGHPLSGQIDKLIALADANPQIVAFNTNGWMKTSVRPQSQWRKWTDDPNKGLYVKQ